MSELDIRRAPTGDSLPWMMEALDEVLYAWYLFSNATTVTAQADYLVELNNRMSDLGSYSPRYDHDRCELVWDGEL